MKSRPPFIDIGVNLTHDQLLDNIDKVINDMIDANVNNAIITSSCIDETYKALEIIDKYPSIFYTTVGFHPHNAKEFKESNISIIKKLLDNKDVVAIGECGLDFYREYSTKREQVNCFEHHLFLASETKKPLFLHERDAFNDFYDMLKNHCDNLQNFVVHCFTGNKSNLIKYLDLGAYIGLTGWLTDTNRGSHLKDIIKFIPHDRIMIETDAPYLIPHNMNFKHDGMNKPAYLPYVAEAVALSMDLELNYLSTITIENTKKFFNLI
tara:strand:+ start:1320 stop:2117 length:798 start_codon:yes stop_codon:yes gene_type:complete